MRISNPFKRINSALATRQNHGGNIETNVENLGFWSGSSRYTDPLIVDHVNDKRIAEHRERVANEDPLGILVTRMFALLGWSRMPKFYESDELGAPEIMQEERAILEMLGTRELCAESTFEVEKHGWVDAYVWLAPDENGQPSWRAEVYSAKQIWEGDIIRDKITALALAQDYPDPRVMQYIVQAPTNAPLVYQVRGRFPTVPSGYGRTGLKAVYRTMFPGMDGLIIHTRGDFYKTSGYGYSRLVDLWDPITKLRVESHGNAKRCELWPLVIYPDGYDQAQVDSLFEALANVDETCGLAMKSGKDAEGNPIPELPSIAFRSPGEDAPNKTGDGGVQGLSSEYVRFCALSGITVKELSGDPGGAEEAGQTDYMQALEKNIQEWNHAARGFLQKLIMQLAKWGVIAPPPPGFVIKGHWEWERDELALQQQAQLEEENSIEEQKAKPTQNSMLDAYALAGHVMRELLPRANAVPGVMSPITSSWVKSYGYDEQDNFYLQFHGAGSTIFKYPYTDDAKATAEGMEQSGSPGGFVHDSPDLGVPRRTPYEKLGMLPDTMAWWSGSQALTEYTAMDERDEKVAAFGTKRPATAPNQANYPQQTGARSEQTTGPQRGAVDMQGIMSQLAGVQGKNITQPGAASTTSGFGSGGGFTPTATAAPTTSTFISPVGQPHPLIAARGHGGHSPRGRKSDASKSGGTFKGVNWNSAIPVARANASLGDITENEWIALSQEANGQGFSKTTVQKIQAVIRGFKGLVPRENHISQGNSMSFKDHPYLYEENGQIVVEYPCAVDWKANVVGRTKRLKINPADTSKHGNVDIGSITYGWDEARGCPADTCDYDRQNVMALIEAAGGQMDGDCVYTRLANDLEPDRSTEYPCRVEVHNGKRWQRDFVAGDTCLVDEGNCPSGECDFVATGE